MSARIGLVVSVDRKVESKIANAVEGDPFGIYSRLLKREWNACQKNKSWPRSFFSTQERGDTWRPQDGRTKAPHPYVT